MIDGKPQDFTPRFRESAYTPIKKLVGEKTPRNFDAMKKAVDKAAAQAIEKKRRAVERVLGCKG
jgi:hydrogenase expression/formation protein